MRQCLCWGLLAVLLVACEKEKEPRPEVIRPVRALQVEELDQVNFRVFPGRTRGVKRSNLSFRVDGPMIERPVDVGDEVKKGTLLARIDPRDFKVKLQNVKGRLEKTDAELRFAERDYQRSLNIYEQDPGAISQSFLDRKKEDVNRLKGERIEFQADVERAKDQLAYTYLRSPYQGVVVSTFVEPHEFVQAKQPIVRVLNTEQVEMVVDIPENMIVRVPFVKKITVDIDAIAGRHLPAKVKEIGTEASETTRTYPVTLVMNQPKGATILAGMAGYARFYFEGKTPFERGGILLPTTAVFSGFDKDKTYVWVIDPETLQVSLRVVKLGNVTSQGVTVSGELKPSEWVVTSGVHSLQEGDKVKILPVALNEKGEQVEANAPPN